MSARLLTEGPLKHAKAAIGGKLGVPHDHKGDSDVMMEPGQHSPHEVLHRCLVLVLSFAVVSMQHETVVFPRL